MMRKIFPALVAVIAVTATGCTHDDDQSGVPAATTAPSTPSVSAPAAVHHPSPAASVSPSRSVACDGIGGRVGGALSFAACGRASAGIGVQGHECGWGVSWP